MRIRVLVGAALIAGLAGCEEPKPISERIKDSCEAQFGKETAQSQDCRIQLMLEELRKQQGQSMDAARKGV